MSPLSTFMNGQPPVRGLFWLGLSDTARFLTRTSVSDGGGGMTETYTPAGTADWNATTNFACRIDPIGGGEGEAAERVSDRSNHIVTFNTGGTITFDLDDDLQIENRGRFEITAIRKRTGEAVQQIEVTDQT